MQVGKLVVNKLSLLLVLQWCTPSISEFGNPSCWYGTSLVYKDCCDTHDGLRPEGDVRCWDKIRSFSRCCSPSVYESYCWDLARRNIRSSLDFQDTPGSYTELLMVDEMLLSQFCCSRGVSYQCWSEDQAPVLHAPFQDTYESITEMFPRCCLPTLRWLLAQDSPTPLVSDLLASELAPWRGDASNLGVAALLRFKLKHNSTACHFRLRSGHIHHCPMARVARHGDYRPWCSKESHILSTFIGVLRMLGSLTRLPDADFFLCCEDDLGGCDIDPSYPLFTQVRQLGAHRALRVPHSHIMHLWGYRIERKVHALDVAWHNKDDRLVFRGSPGGERIRIVSRIMRDVNATWHDARIIDVGAEAKNELALEFPEVHNESLWGSMLSVEQQLSYKFILDMDGGGGPSDRFLWIGLSMSVPFVAASSGESWMGALRQPYEHFVPVDADCSNLAERLSWLRSHSDDAYRIARNSKRLVQDEIRFEHALHWVFRLIQGLASISRKSL